MTRSTEEPSILSQMLKPSANTVQGLEDLHLADLLEQLQKRIKVTGPTREHAGAGPRPLLASVAMYTLVFSGSPNKWNGWGSCPACAPCHWISFPLFGLPGWASWEMMLPRPAGTSCPRVGWYPREEPLQWGGGFRKVGLGKRERGYDQDVK